MVTLAAVILVKVVIVGDGACSGDSDACGDGSDFPGITVFVKAINKFVSAEFVAF